MKIAVIGDKHTVYGFRLAGVRDAYIIDKIIKADIKELFKDLYDKDFGLILITEKLNAELKETLEDVDRFRKGIIPIVLAIPDSSGPLTEKVDPMRDLIRRTIGFELTE